MHGTMSVSTALGAHTQESINLPVHEIFNPNQALLTWRSGVSGHRALYRRHWSSHRHSCKCSMVVSFVFFVFAIQNYRWSVAQVLRVSNENCGTHLIKNKVGAEYFLFVRYRSQNPSHFVQLRLIERLSMKLRLSLTCPSRFSLGLLRLTVPWVTIFRVFFPWLLRSIRECLPLPHARLSGRAAWHIWCACYCAPPRPPSGLGAFANVLRSLAGYFDHVDQTGALEMLYNTGARH